jgi:hypothetical protein
MTIDMEVLKQKHFLAGIKILKASHKTNWQNIDEFSGTKIN